MVATPCSHNNSVNLAQVGELLLQLEHVLRIARLQSRRSDGRQPLIVIHQTI